VIRLNRWLMGGVLLVILAALFIDTYGYTYRFLVEHKGLGAKLDRNPHIGNYDIYIHKGLDLSGGTELTIAICKGFNDPPGSGCRNGPPKNASASDVQNATITVLSQRVNSLGVAEASVQAQGSDQVLVQIPGVSLAKAKEVIGTTAQLHFATPVPGAPNPNDPKFIADQQRHYDPAQFGLDQYYPQASPGWHWKIDPNILATDVTKADVGFSTTQNQYAVDITFNSHGADEWSKITNAAYAQPQGTPQNRIAIFLDNDVITAPQVQQPSSNQTEITGNFTSDQATQLASQISAGALPAEIATVQATEVSATLGANTVRQSLIAGLVGLIIVVLFMVGYYRFPGMLASLALLCYAGIVLALYKLIPVTVTLAGLAGFVLSVGMAVDANVLIFERTRDELRHGRSVPLSVEAGRRSATATSRR
jgi:preprotein translocase subunit SecD